VYRDQDESGRTEDRPGWQLLRQQLWRKGVAAVVVESLSRANRSVRDFFNFLRTKLPRPFPCARKWPASHKKFSSEYKHYRN
jgi:hypothetical protein